MGQLDPSMQVVQESTTQIDPSFILPEEHRPKVAHNEYLSSTGEGVPVIDLEVFRQGEKDPAWTKTVEDVGKACERWGFFQVVNHSVPQDLIDRLARVSQEFFDLDKQEKRRVQKSKENAYGYYDSELTKNSRDWKEVFDYGRKPRPDLPDDHHGQQTLDGVNRWPTEPAAFRPVLEEWLEVMVTLAYEILHAISLSLGLPANHFDQYYTEHSSLIRLNYYPLCPNPNLALGVNRHKDAGAITILQQDAVGGLQVEKDGEWIGVEPRADSFVINIGDMMTVWSNGRYQSPQHRVVVNSRSDRFSVPFFFNPSYKTDVAPVPQLLDDEHPPRYRAVNWGHFRSKRAEGDYADYGEEIQIDHFLIK